MSKKHSFAVLRRAFRIWQRLGYNPWRRMRGAQKKGSGNFYRGAFDSIPFLNDDAKRTFTHLLLRPGYMIRDYIRGDHERYLAPLTALIIFYSFFALVASVMRPLQQQHSDPFDIEFPSGNVAEPGVKLVRNALILVQRGYTYLTLDQHPEAVTTRHEAALAALEDTLRSQGIPLFLGEFFLLWTAMTIALSRYRLRMSATAAASAYVLCQFSFIMLFAVLVTLGRSQSTGLTLLFLLLAVDVHQWLDVSWRKSFRLALRTGIIYGLLFTFLLLVASIIVVIIAWRIS